MKTVKFTNNGLFPIRYLLTRKRNTKSDQNLNKGFATKGISIATTRKIKIHARVLSFLAKTRKVRSSKGDIVAHKISFITLTLPAQQVHDDTFITKEILGNFLDRSRKLGLLENYVWRAEKQKNGNIHYHILTDTFASFSLFRRIWYLALKKFGYLQRYSEKFSAMSYSEYHKLPFNAKKSEVQISSAYARGVRNCWSEPPCIDLEFESDSKNLEGYIAKYLSKEESDGNLFVAGRVWGVSRSLTLAVKEFKDDQEFNSFWWRYGREVLKKKIYETDFFSVVLCTLSSIIGWVEDCHKNVKNAMYIHFRPCQYFVNYGQLV